MSWKLVLSIIILGFILRISFLPQHPAGFTPDEASFGFDAYSILKTGKDQWGNTLPLVFKSFGDNKLPLYGYLSIPFVFIFGLNEFAVRLPGALFGTLAILAVYLAVKVIFKFYNLKFSLEEKNIEIVAILSALFLAISPWHISLSRGAFEANLTSFFLAFGIFCFFRGIEKQRFWLVVSVISFGLNLFSYHSARLITPLIVLFLILTNIKNIKEIIRAKSSRTYLVIAIILSIVFTFTSFYLLISQSTRSSDIAIYSPTGGWGELSDRRFEAVKLGLPDFVSRIFSNKPLFVIRLFFQNYLSYFSFQFLFTQGAGEWTYGMIPGWGVLYIFELPFILMAVYKFVKNRSLDSALGLIVFWILVSPIPAALTKGPGYAGNRIAVMMPAIQILSAYGAFEVFKILSDKVGSKIPVFLAALFTVPLIFFIEDYIYQAPIRQSSSMLYGRKEMVAYARQIENSYENIIISRSLSEPQIYLAFYGKWNPIDYQKETINWDRFRFEGKSFVDQLGSYRLGKYTFSDINYYSNSKIKSTLLVGKPDEFPENINTLKTISYPGGKPAILFVDTLRE